MARIKSAQEIEQKRRDIDALRDQEKEIGLDDFTRGQLAGAQQTLYWFCGMGMEPIRAILADDQLLALATSDNS